MPIVTDKKFYMETAMLNLFDKCIRRQNKKFDHLWVYDGDEGIGKTTMAMAHAYYLAWKTGQKFSLDNVFFDPDKMMKFAGTTEKQIIVWDEACMGAMSDDYHTGIQKKIIKILMMSRKKGHFWIFCIPKFHTLREYIAVDRTIGLIHVYSHDDEQRGRFVYFKKKKKDYLYFTIRKTKIRDYRKYSFRGKFTDVTKKNLIDWAEYEKKKDKAILSVFENQNTNGNVYRQKFIIERYGFSLLAQFCKTNYELSYRQIATLTKCDHGNFNKGLKFPEKYPEIFKNPEKPRVVGNRDNIV